MDTQEKIELRADVPLSKLENLRKKISDLNKRAKKFDLPEITLSFGKKFYKKIRYYDEDFEVPFINCTVIGTYPRIPGYKFLAKLERVGDRNLILGRTDIGEEWITKDNYCDHCKSKRQRKETYLLQKEETGEISQVGSSCIDIFVGMSSLEAITWRASLYNLFEDETMDPHFDEAEKNPNVVFTEDFIAASIAAIRAFGFVSKANGIASSLTSTAMHAFNKLVPVFKYAEFNVSEADIELAALALKDLDSILEGNQISANIKTVCSSPELHRDYIFIAVLLAKIALDKRGEITKIKKEAKPDALPSNYVGSVGDRIDVLVTVNKRLTFESSYGYGGTAKMMIMADASGNVFVTTTTGSFCPSQDAIIEIRGTVKAHKTYNGKKQTVLQRVSIVKDHYIELLKAKLKEKDLSMICPRQEDGIKNPESWVGHIDQQIREEIKALELSLEYNDFNSRLGNPETLEEGVYKFSYNVRSDISNFQEDIEFEFTHDKNDERIKIVASLLSK